MKKSKIVQILSTFSREELKSFEKFVKSPFFSTGRNVIPLLRVLKKYYPDFAEDSITKENIYAEVFKTEEFSEKKLKNLVIDLTKLADEFMISGRTAKDAPYRERALAAEYRDRKLNKYYSASIRMIENKIRSTHFNSNDCFTHEEEFERLNQEYYVGVNKWEKVVASKAKYAEYFMLTFIIRYLRTLREKHVAESAYNYEYSNPVLEEMDKFFNADELIETLIKNNYEYSYLLAIYLYAYKSTRDENGSEYYKKLKELILEHLESFSQAEKYSLFSDMVSYCIEKDRDGKDSLLEEEFSLYKEMIKHNAYSWSDDDYMQIVTFRNIMITSLSLKEYRWLEWFTENYTVRLKPEYRDNMRNLVLANIRYAEKEYEESLGFISKVKYDVFLYKIDVRNLLLRLYYELDMFEQAFYSVDSYRHFLTDTTELSAYYKTQNINFLNFYNQLLKIKSGSDPGELDFITSEVISTETISLKNWLLEKANELIKKGA